MIRGPNEAWVRYCSKCGLVRHAQRMGTTLVDLVAVVAILGVLISLLLLVMPPVRARARRFECLVHLTQQGKAALLHEQAHRHFPTCGWGNLWIGVVDRGFGARQPGGWIYNVLPFCEESGLWQTAPKSSGQVSTVVFERFVTSVVPIFLCPERAGSPIIDVDVSFVPRLGHPVRFAARTDFAMNAGDGSNCPRSHGPETLAIGDANSYPWPTSQCDGVCFQRSQIDVREIRDGTSKVILCGEKWIRRLGLNPPDGGANQPHVSGDCSDIRRTTDPVVARDGEGGNVDSFGSAHFDGAGFAFCDGSVQVIDYSIDPFIFMRLGGRNDGE